MELEHNFNEFNTCVACGLDLHDAVEQPCGEQVEHGMTAEETAEFYAKLAR